MRGYVALLLVPLLVASCSGSPTSPEDAALRLATVVQYSYSGYPSPARSVIGRTEDWSQVWRTLHGGTNPGPAIPAVDFGREMLVLAAAGTRSNGCYGIEITAAMVGAGGGTVFEVTETVPGSACLCTQEITQPAHVVRLARVPGAARFVERQRVLAC